MHHISQKSFNLLSDLTAESPRSPSARDPLFRRVDNVIAHQQRDGDQKTKTRRTAPLQIADRSELYYSRPNHSTCARNYTKKQVIGKGTYGRVSRACRTDDPSDCKYAMKESDITNKNRLDTALRDEYYLRELQDVYMENGHAIAPKLFESWTCDEDDRITSHLVMEAWNNNMETLGRQQAQKITVQLQGLIDRYPKMKLSPVKEICVFTVNQLVYMLTLAQALDEHGIIHGDLKADQYLMRQGPHYDDDWDDITMVVNDFGFAGDLWGPDGAQTGEFRPRVGWSASDVFKCDFEDEYRMTDAELSDSEFAKFYNVWQLESALTLYESTFVLNPDSRAVQVFTGFDVLSNDVRKHFANHCSNYAERLLLYQDRWRHAPYLASFDPFEPSPPSSPGSESESDSDSDW